MKAATEYKKGKYITAKISIHAAREGGDEILLPDVPEEVISIHAAREGGDKGTRPRFATVGISIHAAREGGD